MNGNDITMMMLGPNGVGKTTLLATMYQELLRLNENSSFTFLADNDTGIELDNAFHMLSQIIRQPIHSRVEALLESTVGIHKRRFEIFLHGTKEFDFVFCDHQGAFVTEGKSGEADKQEFLAILQQATVVINVIDGAAMMAGSEMFASKFNRPTLVHNLLVNALNDEQDHLILFVITKCEKWLKDPKGYQLLKEQFEKRHKPVLNLIQQHKAQNNVVGVFLPVKTLGCVEYSRVIDYDGPDETIEFTLKPGLSFEPMYIEQPLRYALAFILSEYKRNLNVLDGIWWWWSGKDKIFREAFSKFANGRNKSFDIYGNPALLDF